MGEFIEVSFTLPETDKPLKVKGKVVREVRDEQDGHYVGGMGVAFGKLGKKAHKAIEDFIDASMQAL